MVNIVNLPLLSDKDGRELVKRETTGYNPGKIKGLYSALDKYYLVERMKRLSDRRSTK